MKFKCAHCGETADKATGHVKRARARGLKLYCDRRCSGLGRRDGKTKAQRVEEKRLYDMAYRAKNLESIKAKKKAHFQKTYDRKAAAEYRKQRMHLHVEYCRRPEYRAWKREYDRKYRAKEFGDFAEAYMLTLDLNREIRGRTTRHEVKYQNGCTNKAQRRKRQGIQEERGRNSRRGGSGNPATHGW
jgi:hypothetical protein